jgi:hypothetical protein
VVWRLLIAASAGAGVALAAREYDVWWTALSQLANLAVALCFLGLAIREPHSPWIRGSLTTTMLLVSLAYLPMANGNLAEPWSVLEHMVTPALVLVDFVLVGDNRHRVRWWHPLTWLAAPAAYLFWYVAGDLQVYAVLDPGRPGAFAGQVLALGCLALGAGWSVHAAARRVRAGARVRT